MPLGSYVNGAGNITASISNANVYGVGTTFLTQLRPGASIANVGNVFVGYVAYVNSNTSLVLRANANVAINSNSYHYATFIANAVTPIYNCNGNITTNTTTNVIFGNNTSFINDVEHGDSLYLPNTNPNSSGDILIGVVNLVVDNTILYLTSNCASNVTSNQFYKTTRVYNSSSPIGSGRAFDEPDIMKHVSTLNSSMYDWSYSGLIPGISAVHQYHPPMRDPVTGILVNLPATIHTNTDKPATISNYIIGNVNFNTANSMSTLDDSYSNGYGNLIRSGKNYHIKDFDDDHKVFGTDVAHVHRHLHNGSQIKKLTDLDDDNHFREAIRQIVPNTAVDNFGALINANVSRVTDSLENARQYFGRVGGTEQLKAEGGINFGENQDMSLRPMPIGLKKLVPTGVPMAIPGILNIKVDTDEPKDTTWVPPQFRKTNVK
jgi:hypothetical protein